MNGEKNDCAVKTYVSRSLELELRREAERQGLDLSTLVRVVLSRYIYGHRAPDPERSEGPGRPD